MPCAPARAAATATLVESAIVRPKSRAVLAAALALAFALALAGQAAAGNGGIAPVSPQSPNAQSISDAYWLIMGFTGAVFVIVEGALIIFVIRFRSRGRDRNVEGPQIRGNTNLEIAWTVVPVLILAAIAAFVFYKLPSIKNTPSARAGGGLQVTVVAHQFYWEFKYPGGRVSIDDMVVPVDSVVTLEVVSKDVAHSWWIPRLGGKIDAIPGRTNTTWFRTSRVGIYHGQCAEFCGILHAAMRADVQVVPAAQFQAFLDTHAPGSTAVGKESFNGVCAKCHGFSGQGDIGPKLKGSALLSDPKGLESLLRTGKNKMPAVGKDWSAEQMQATITYLKGHFGGG